MVVVLRACAGLWSLFAAGCGPVTPAAGAADITTGEQGATGHPPADFGGGASGPDPTTSPTTDPTDACDVGPDPNAADLAGQSPLGAFSFPHSWFGVGNVGGCSQDVRIVALGTTEEMAEVADADHPVGLDEFAAGIEIQIPAVGQGLTPGPWPARIFHRSDGRTATREVLVTVLWVDLSTNATGGIAATIETDDSSWTVQGSVMARYCAAITMKC